MSENSEKQESSSQRSNRDRNRHSQRNALWAALASLVVLLPLVLFSGTLIFFQVRQLNLPTVFVYDQNVGLISRDATDSLVNEIYNQNRHIVLTTPGDSDITYTLSPHALGFWVDPQATARAAFAVGRASGPLTDLRFAFSGEDRVVMPVLYYDQNQARKTLESIAGELEITPIDASIAFQDGAWVSLPAEEGRAVDIEQTLDDLLENAFPILITGKANLHMQTLQPEVTDLSPLLAQIDALVARDYQLTAYDPITDQTFTWSIPQESKLAWVTVDPAGNQANLSISPDEVSALLDLWTEDLGEGRGFDPALEIPHLLNSWQADQTPSILIYHHPTTYLVGQGESLWSISLKVGIPLWHIVEANPGLTMDNLSPGMSLTIPSKNILLPLPPVPGKRIIIDISQQRMTVIEDGIIRNTHIISTGMVDSPTMAGVFQIQTHVLNAYASNWDLYMPHFMGIYEAWPGFMNGIHGLPLLSGGGRLWASNLGSPASYGCIILNLAAAEDLYYWADPGVVVEIRN
ncbi:MAG: peptidoglycan binding domain-containing protein [Brevefilum sp.]